MELRPTETTSQIFESHFTRILEPDVYERVKAIFDSAAAFNERSFAVQIQYALQFDRLEEVIAAYENLIEASDYQDMDFISRTVFLRRFADIVYGQIITDGDPMQIFQKKLPVEILEIFDRMSQEEN